MPGLAHREKKMRHAWNALRTILVCALTIGVLAMNALAAPGDQPSPTDKFKNLEFREIGPAVMGGRFDDFAVVESNPSIVYVGTASGGVWKTTNNRSTPGRPGRRWSGSKRRATSGESSYIPEIRTSFTLRRSDTCGERIPSAAFTKRPTAARLGLRFSRSTTTPA